jgi:hypothetical protein
MMDGNFCLDRFEREHCSRVWIEVQHSGSPDIRSGLSNQMSRGVQQSFTILDDRQQIM